MSTAITLQLPAGTLAELAAYARRRGLPLVDAGAYVLAYGLVRLALVDPAIDPDITDDDAAAAVGEALASSFAVAARDAMFAVTRSPEAEAIGWQGLAVALCAYRGALSPVPDATQAAALVNLDAGDELSAADAAALSAWLKRRTREAEELAALTEDDARAVVAQAEEEVAAIRRKVRA